MNCFEAGLEKNHDFYKKIKNQNLKKKLKNQICLFKLDFLNLNRIF